RLRRRRLRPRLRPEPRRLRNHLGPELRPPQGPREAVAGAPGAGREAWGARKDCQPPTPPCHPERSEGSAPVISVIPFVRDRRHRSRSFVAALLRMTIGWTIALRVPHPAPRPVYLASSNPSALSDSAISCGRYLPWSQTTRCAARLSLSRSTALWRRSADETSSTAPQPAASRCRLSDFRDH